MTEEMNTAVPTDGEVLVETVLPEVLEPDEPDEDAEDDEEDEDETEEAEA